MIWIVCQQNIQEFLRAVPAERQYQVSFEELVRAPQQVMEGICHFLKLEYHPAMIEPYQGKRMTDGVHPLSKMIGDIKFHEHRAIDATAAEQWKAEQDDYAPAEITTEIAASLGYAEFRRKQIDEAGVQAPSSLTARTIHTGNLPLSFAQERLWFLDQWVHHPGDEQGSQRSAYNIYSNLHMEGRLHIRTLERSLNEIVQRHEVLRTTFVATDGYPAQVIAPSLQIPLPVVDLRGLPQAEQERTMALLATQEVEQPFDLSRGPLLRTTLVRLREVEHIFLLTIHHIVADGWSISVFNQELAALYEAFTRGQLSPLPSLPIQYADFALWQRQRLQGAVLQEQLQYWRQQLQGAPTLLPLPTDRPRPAIQTFAGAAHSIILTANLTNSLKALSQAGGVTLFTTLLAAFQTLLSRWTQQDDISVGTYIAGRTDFETERLIGFFINDLVLRTDLSGDPSFRTLLQRAGQVTHGAFAHQDVPFEHLIQELQPERNPSHTPFFQVMLIYQNMPRHDLTFSGLTMHIMGLDVTRANFDLSLWVVEEAAKLYLSFEYNTDLFEATTIQHMANHLQNLLAAIVRNPDQRLSVLPLISEREYHQLLLEEHATRSPFASHASIDDLLAAQHMRTPDAIALVFDDQHLTYDELHQRAAQLAHSLQRLGVTPETPVGICLERSLDTLISMLAILKAGGAYVPLDPGHPKERLAFIMDETHIPVLLTHSSLLGRLPQTSAIAVCLDTNWSTVTDTDYSPLAHTSSALNLAYVIYTSGSNRPAQRRRHPTALPGSFHSGCCSPL